MGTRYITIDADQFHVFMVSQGFETIHQVNSNEVVYGMQSSIDPNLVIKVYSSIPIGSDVAREIGADAIRCVAVDTQTSKGIYKGARAYRTGSFEKVCARIKERIAEAEACCNEWKARQLLSHPSPTVVRAPPKPVEFNIRDEVQLRLTVVDCVERNTSVGICHVFTMKNDAGQTFVYWSGWPDRLVIGGTYDVKGIVYWFNTFRGVKQITLSNLRGKRVDT